MYMHGTMASQIVTSHIEKWCGNVRNSSEEQNHEKLPTEIRCETGSWLSESLLKVRTPNCGRFSFLAAVPTNTQL